MKALVPILTMAMLAVVPAALSAPKALCVGGPGCYPTLQAAVAAANDGDTIRVNAGTFAGGVTIAKSVKLVGAGASATVIAGGGPVLTIGVFHAASEPTVSISGVTITGGVTTSSFGSGGSRAAGGGVQIPANADCSGGATVTITDSVITNNTAAPSAGGTDVAPCPGSHTVYSLAAGGGIYNAGELTLVRTTVSANTAGGPTASNAWGGGILSTPQGGSLTILDSVVRDNQAAVVDPNGVQATGAGILAQTGDFVVKNSLVIGNSAKLTSAKGSVDGVFQANAGGIGCDRSADITGTRIDGNVATVSDANGEPAAFDSGMGCGSSGGTLSLKNSSVSNNRVIANVADTTDSGPDGTALEFDDAAVVTNTVVQGNAAVVKTAGGLAAAQGAVLDLAAATVTINNAVVAGNTMSATNASGPAQVFGGGIANAGALALKNVAVTGNTGTATGAGGTAQGGGIWNGSLFGSTPSLLSLENTAVSGNRLGGSGSVVVQGAGIYSLGFGVSLKNAAVAHNTPDQCFGLTC